MRIRIPPLFRRRPTIPTDPTVTFIVRQAFAGDLGPYWTEDTADWPVEYNSYTSENAFCEALKAKATTDIVTIPNGIVAHTLTLQPYTKPASTGNEDRHTVQYWELPSGRWTFVGVFDGVYDSIAFACYPGLTSTWDVGHSGHETSEYTVQSLPPTIRSRLESVLRHDSGANPTAIGEALSEAIQAFDKSFEDDLKAAIPEDFESLSDEELQGVINDQVTGGHVYTKVIRCMRGACSIVVVIDPAKENLWSINLGDCEAGQYMTRVVANTKLTWMTWASAWRKGVVRGPQNVDPKFDTQRDDRRREGEDPCRSPWRGRGYAQQPCPGCFRTHPWCVVYHI